MQKKILLTFFIFVSIANLNAQTTKYRVQFTDKNSSPYSISNPSAFLTARAIQRRANQGIAIVQNDLPPNPSYIAQVLATGASPLHQSRWFNSLTVVVPNATVLAAIQALPFVQSTTPVNKIKNVRSIFFCILKNLNFEKN